MNRKIVMDKGSVGLLKAARGALHWSQEDLAERSGVSLSTIKKMERRAFQKNKLPRKEPRGSTQGDEFFTTKEIIDAMITAFGKAGVTIEKQGSQSRIVVDPCTGSADFLTAAMRFNQDNLENTGKESEPCPNEMHRWKLGS